LSPGESVSLGVRPEHLTLSEGGALRGEALVVERLGSATHVHIAVEGGAMITVQGGDDLQVRPHDLVSVKVSGETAHLFDASGRAVPRLGRDRQVKDT
jgi:multiple sugar transport system ATP-binding protein